MGRESRAGTGRLGRLGFPYPPLGSILFDGETLPPEPDPQWRWLFRLIWQQIADELVLLAPFNVRGAANE